MVKFGWTSCEDIPPALCGIGDKFKCHKTRQICVNVNSLCPSKNGGHKPSGLGSGLIVIVRQVGRQAGNVMKS